ncbi:MAG: hypothetical protein FJ137_17285 [Deltaproteobacteria bacterium]|nr:hypothetical protein [Deltaproteobacteria bacterium]
MLAASLRAGALTAGLLAAGAHAVDVGDEGFALERLRPATTAAGVNDVEWAAVGQDGQWITALWLH